MADENNKLAVTHKDRFPPEMFENNTFDLMKKGADLGLDPEAVKVLNRERYLRNLKLLEQDGMMLEIMPTQTTEMILTALYQNPKSFIHVTNQNEEVCEYILRKDSSMLEYIKDQTEEQIVYAIKKDAWNVLRVHEPQQHHFMLALEVNYNIWRDIPEKYRNMELLKKGIEISSHETKGGRHYSQDSLLGYLGTDDFTEEVIEFALTTAIDNLQYIPWNVKVDVKWGHKYVMEYPRRIRRIRHHIDRDGIVLAFKSYEDYWHHETIEEAMQCFTNDQPLTEEYVRKIRALSHLSISHKQFNRAVDDGCLSRKDVIRDLFNGEIYLSDVRKDKWDTDIIVWAMKYSAYHTRKTLREYDRFNFFKNPANRFLSFLLRIGLIRKHETKG